MKDNEKADLVNRLTAVARLYHASGQLRERVRDELEPVFKKLDERRNQDAHDRERQGRASAE